MSAGRPLELVEPGEALHGGEQLCVEVPGAHVRWLYAASLYTDARGVRRFRPLEWGPEFLAVSGYTREGSFGLRLPPSSASDLAVPCAIVDANNRAEEMLLYVATGVRPDIEDWFRDARAPAGPRAPATDTLLPSEPQAGSPQADLAWEEACGLYSEPSDVRGGPVRLQGLTAAQIRASLALPAATAAVPEPVHDLLAHSGVEWHHLFWPVLPR